MMCEQQKAQDWEKLRVWIGERRSSTFFITINLMFALIFAQIVVWLNDSFRDARLPTVSSGVNCYVSSNGELSINLNVPFDGKGKIPKPSSTNVSLLQPSEAYSANESRGDQITDAKPVAKVTVTPIPEKSVPFPYRWLPVAVAILLLVIVYVLWLFFISVFIIHNGSERTNKLSYLLCLVLLVSVCAIPRLLDCWPLIVAACTLSLVLVNFSVAKDLATLDPKSPLKKRVLKWKNNAIVYTIGLIGLGVLIIYGGMKINFSNLSNEAYTWMPFGLIVAGILIFIFFYIPVRLLPDISEFQKEVERSANDFIRGPGLSGTQQPTEN